MDVPHGLGVVPEFIIIKSTEGTTFWVCYHTGLGTPGTTMIRLNLTNAKTIGDAYFDDTAPTSSVFRVGDSSATNGPSFGTTGIAYLFASKSGVCKIVSWTGNGSTSGPSLTGLGATGRALLAKRIDDVGPWLMIDSDRGDNYLVANDTDAEAAANYVDWTSDGADIVSDNADINASGGTYIGMILA